jgi:hypothetical protein
MSCQIQSGSCTCALWPSPDHPGPPPADTERRQRRSRRTSALDGSRTRATRASSSSVHTTLMPTPTTPTTGTQNQPLASASATAPPIEWPTIRVGPHRLQQPGHVGRVLSEGVGPPMRRSSMSAQVRNQPSTPPALARTLTYARPHSAGCTQAMHQQKDRLALTALLIPLGHLNSTGIAQSWSRAQCACLDLGSTPHHSHLIC